MDAKSALELKITEAHGEMTSINAQWVGMVAERRSNALPSKSKLIDRGASIMRPDLFWGRALESTETDPREAALGIKMAAAKLKAGDIDFVMESGLGQIGWLSSIALEAKEDAEDLPLDSVARMKLLDFSLRAQGAAAKLMLSLAALVQMRGGN